MDKIKQMQSLIKEIDKHNYNYYVLDNPTISDKEYDKLYYSLVDLEKETGVTLPQTDLLFESKTRVGVLLEKEVYQSFRFLQKILQACC